MPIGWSRFTCVWLAMNDLPGKARLDRTRPADPGQRWSQRPEGWPNGDGAEGIPGQFLLALPRHCHFRSQVLRSWQERTTDQVIQELESDKAEPERLKHLMKRAFNMKRSLDRAIRSWAAEDDDVAKVVASVDARRVAYIAKLLVAAGVESRRALPRAAFMYWAYLGQPIVRSPPFIHNSNGHGRYQRPVSTVNVRNHSLPRFKLRHYLRDSSRKLSRTRRSHR